MKKVSWNQVYQDEQKYITKYQKDYDAKKSIGLALSGGGIRSAAFSIGVMQALQNKKILSKISYLSTVSGGGFSGSALSWFKLKFKTFPFGDKKSFQGSQALFDSIETDPFKTLKKSSTSASNAILSYIRQHGNYLVPFELGKAALLARALLSVLHSALAYLLIISLVFLFLFWLISWGGIMDYVWKTFGYIGVDKWTISNLLYIWENSHPSNLQIDFMAAFLVAAIMFAAFYFVAVVLYGLSTFFSQETPGGYCLRVWVERAMGWLVTLLAGTLVLAIIPFGSELMAFAGNKDISTGVSGGTTIIGALVAVFKFWQDISGKESKGGVLSSLLMQGVVLLVIFAVLSLGFRVGAFALASNTPLWILAGITVFIALVVNLNLVSPHRMYRDRLAETFLWNFDKGAEAKLCDRGNLALQTPLSEMVTDKEKNWTPYHLVNTNLVLTDSKTQKYRGRLGDGFILSPKFCGSEATGYASTKEFMNDKMTLATAMAASGAAVNPNAGAAGSGPTTSASVSFLMTFFGLRLGIWVPNPRWKFLTESGSDRLPPNYIFPGLKSLLSFGQAETNYRIELSDGAHFDNTGLYELVRRRVTTIILSEAGADKDFNFGDLGNAIEKARVDFGVRINFKKFDLDGILPGSEAASETGTGKVFAEKFDLSQRGHAIATIHYPRKGNEPEKTGKLFFIKAALVRDLPSDIYAYKAVNDVFPNQSTVDQFFDERQFEAYRELGYQLAKTAVVKLV